MRRCFMRSWMGTDHFLPKGHHPTFVLFLDIEPDRLDVNVHPTKKEVRFAETEALHQLVRQSVRHALGGPERKVVLGLTQAGLSPTIPEFAPTAGRQPSSSGDFHPAPLTATPRQDARNKVSDTVSLSGTVEGNQLAFVHEAAAAYQQAERPGIVPLGQILRTYLVAQVGDELQVVDQHTAHERVLFQRLWRGWQSRDIPSQPLLIPEPIELSAAQSTLLLKRRDDLEKLGLLIEPFGATAVAIRGVPVGLGQGRCGCLGAGSARRFDRVGHRIVSGDYGFNLCWRRWPAMERCVPDVPWPFQKFNS